MVCFDVAVVVGVVPTTGTSVVLRCFGTTNASDGDVGRTQSTIAITVVILIDNDVGITAVVLLDIVLFSLCVIILVPLLFVIGVVDVDDNDSVVGIFVIAGIIA